MDEDLIEKKISEESARQNAIPSDVIITILK